MFRPHVKLVQEPGAGARIVDETRQRSQAVTPIEGRLLALLAPGMTLEVLPAAAKAAGVDLEASQIEAVLTRLHASGFVELTGPAKAPEKALRLDEVVPAFRSDLEVTSVGGSTRVTDKQADRSFTLYEFEVHLARLLDGRHTVKQVLDAAQKLSVPVGAEGLARFIGQMRAYGFLSGPTPEPVTGPSTWGTRTQWSPEARELYQSALRLFRQGRREAALEYVQSLLELQPDTPEAAALKRQIEAADPGDDLATDDTVPELVAESEPLMSSGEMPAVKLPPEPAGGEPKPWATVKPWSRTPMPTAPKSEPRWEPKPSASTTPASEAKPPATGEPKPWAKVEPKPWATVGAPKPPTLVPPSAAPAPLPPPAAPAPLPPPVASAPVPAPSPSPSPSGSLEQNPWATLTPRFSPPVPPSPRFSPPVPPAPKLSPPMPPRPAVATEVRPAPRSSPPMPPPALALEPSPVAPPPAALPVVAPLPSPRFSPPLPPAPKLSPPMPPRASALEPQPSPVAPPPAAPVPEAPEPKPSPLAPPLAAAPLPAPSAPAPLRPSRPIFGRPFTSTPSAPEPRPSPIAPPPAAAAPPTTPAPDAAAPPATSAPEPKPSRPIFGRPSTPAPSTPIFSGDGERKTALESAFTPPGSSTEGRAPKPSAPVFGKPIGRVNVGPPQPDSAPLSFAPTPTLRPSPPARPVREPATIVGPPPESRGASPSSTLTDEEDVSALVTEAPPANDAAAEPPPSTPGPPESPLTLRAELKPASQPGADVPAPRRSRPMPAATEPVLPPVRGPHDTQPPPRRSRPALAVTEPELATVPADLAARPIDTLDSEEPFPEGPPTDALKNRRTISKPGAEASMGSTTEPVTGPADDARRTLSKPQTEAAADPAAAPEPVPAPRRTLSKPQTEAVVEPAAAPEPAIAPPRTQSKPQTEAAVDPAAASEPVPAPPRTQSKPQTEAVSAGAEGPVPEALPIPRRSSGRVPKQEEPPPKRAGLYAAVGAVLLLAALAFPIPAVQRIDVELVTTPKAQPKMPAGVFGELKVQSGARVDEGAVIATLDTSKLKAQKEELTAQVARLDAAAAKTLARANPGAFVKARQVVAKAKQDVAKARAQLPRARDRAKAEVDLAKKEAVVERAERAADAIDTLEKARMLKLEATAGREKLAALQTQLGRAAVTAPASGVFELDQLPPAGAQFDEGTAFGRIVEKDLLVKGAPTDGKDPVLVLGDRRVALFAVDQRPEGLTVPFESGMTPGHAVLEVSKGYRPWPMVVFSR